MLTWRYATHCYASLGDLALARGDLSRANEFADESRGEADSATPDVDVVSASPQPPQNFSPGAFANPHEEHGLGSGAPHCAQNRRPDRFAWSHCMQRDGSVRKGRSSGTRTSDPTAGYDEACWRDSLASLFARRARHSLARSCSPPSSGFPGRIPFPSGTLSASGARTQLEIPS